jgi:hypothetical protein
MLSRRFSINSSAALITIVEQLTARMTAEWLKPNAREGPLPIAIKVTIVQGIGSLVPGHRIDGLIGEAMLRNLQ